MKQISDHQQVAQTGLVRLPVVSWLPLVEGAVLYALSLVPGQMALVVAESLQQQA